jgi:isocitrate dehydrogenase (NAD+)
VGSRLTIVRIAGDGVGSELVAAGSRLVESVCGLVEWVDRPAGLAAFAVSGFTAPAQTLSAIRRHKLALKGPFATPNGGQIRSGNYYLRRDLDLYACLRPIPVDPDRAILLVRENVEDLYPAVECGWGGEFTFALKVASRRGCQRIASHAFELARRERRRKVTVVHKANNLKLTEGLFLQVARSTAERYPEVAFEDMLADTAGAMLVNQPERFDVVLTSNTFGDLLSSVGAAVAGSLGVVGSLNSGAGIHVAEAAHGHAPELAGGDRVNPCGFFDAVRLLLAAAGRSAEAAAVAGALREADAAGLRTLDLHGHARTSEVVEFVCARAARRMAATSLGR